MSVMVRKKVYVIDELNQKTCAWLVRDSFVMVGR